MWNFFKRNKKKKQLREIRNLSTLFGILDQLSKRGNIYWKERKTTFCLLKSVSPCLK